MRNYSKAVIIPVYKEQPNNNEIISYQRCIEVLGSTQIIIIAPYQLNLSFYQSYASKHAINILYLYFEKNYFANISGYNRLMLSEDFYMRFTNYDYILIYQLDCYVFRDDLNYWCSQGYDYIGSPWIIGNMPTFKSRIIQKIKLLLNKPNDLATNQFKVGNGGLSLRKPAKFAEIVKRLENTKRLNQYIQSQTSNYNEDMFWSFEVNRYISHLRIPPWKKALKFGFELNPDLCFQLNDKKLPFGCHAFEKSGENFWQSYFTYDSK